MHFPLVVSKKCIKFAACSSEHDILFAQISDTNYHLGKEFIRAKPNINGACTLV